MVAALGLAATRDFVSFLRHAVKDEAGTPIRSPATCVTPSASRSPSPHARSTISWRSASTRTSRGGASSTACSSGPAAAAAIRSTIASRRPDRTERNRQNHLYPEGVFPFAYPVLTDHLSGRTGGRIARCAASNTCPKIFDANSANEYWVKAGSLLHTDTRGQRSAGSGQRALLSDLRALARRRAT